MDSNDEMIMAQLLQGKADTTCYDEKVVHMLPSLFTIG
jgi:hypothetical protein